MQAQAHSAFDILHPSVGLAYCAAVLVFSMVAFQPVFLALAFAGMFAWRVLMAGWRLALRGLAWQVPLVLLLAVANPLFVGQGSTELFRLGSSALYLESLVYGLCQGLMLATVLLAFMNAGAALDSDKVMNLLGRAFPTVALMLSMTMRLIPQFASRGRDIAAVQAACTAAAPRTACTTATTSVGTSRAAGLHMAVSQVAASGEGEAENEKGATGSAGIARAGKRLRLKQNLRLSTVLMGWALEDSLESADAMRARGWGAARRRTAYERYRFRAFDGAVLAVVVLLAAASAAVVWLVMGGFVFYPHIEGWPHALSYLPFGMLFALGALLEAMLGGNQ